MWKKEIMQLKCGRCETAAGARADKKGKQLLALEGMTMSHLQESQSYRKHQLNRIQRVRGSDSARDGAGGRTQSPAWCTT